MREGWTNDLVHSREQYKGAVYNPLLSQGRIYCLLKNSIIPTLFSLLALGVLLINNFINYGNNFVVSGLIIIICVISVIYRLRVQLPGILFLESVYFAIATFISYTLFNQQIFNIKTENILQILLLVCFLTLVVEVVITICKPQKIIFEILTIKEVILVLIVSMINFITVMSFSNVKIEGIEILMTIFFVSMTLTFSYSLINKFGAIISIMTIFSVLISFLGSESNVNLLLPKESRIEIIFLGFIVGVITECCIASLSLKNIKFIFHSVRYGYVNNSYLQVLDSMQVAVVISIVMPSTILLLTKNIEGYKEFFNTLTTGCVVTLFGSVIAAIFTRGLKEWGLYNIFHYPIKLMWTREFPKWIPCCSIADVDGDGKSEVIVGCADNCIYCFKDGVEVWKKNVGNVPSPVIGVGKVGKGDDTKIVIGTYNGSVICLNSSGEEVWRIEIGQWVWCVTIGDVDNDGENEVIAGGMDDTIHVYKDGGKELWSTYFDSWVGCCVVADIDNDGHNELIAGSNDQTLRCFKNGPNELWRAWFGEWVNCCAVGDVDNDGLNEVVAGSNDGTLRCFKNGHEIWRITIMGGPGAVTIGDIDNDGMNEIVVGCGDHTLRVIKNSKEVWIGRLDRYPDCVAVGDVDNDGKNEILSGDWYSYVRCFKL